MSRRSRDWLSPRDDGTTPLDTLLAETWDGATAVLAQILDLRDGKAALLAAWHAQQATRAPEGREAEDDGPSRAAAAVCADVDLLLTVLAAEIGPGLGHAHSAVTAYLLASHRFLAQLRGGLTGRSLDRAAALQLTGSTGHALTGAVATLHRLPPAPPGTDPTDEATGLAQTLANVQQQLPHLDHKITRLFDGTRDTTPRVPVPHQ